VTDREYAAQKKRIKTLFNKWVSPLGLGSWKIEILFARLGIRENDKDEKWLAYFITECRWEYQQALIRVSAPDVATLDDRELERDFVHELAHCILNEAKHFSAEDGSEHEERVATQLTNAFIWLREEKA
jgi:hypothetical protein